MRKQRFVSMLGLLVILTSTIVFGTGCSKTSAEDSDSAKKAVKTAGNAVKEAAKEVGNNLSQKSVEKKTEKGGTLRKTPNPASDFKYELNEKGDAVIIKSYIGEDLDIWIPAEIEGFPVKKLERELFAEFFNLNTDKKHYYLITSIIIPEPIQEIGEKAFKNCYDLKTVVIADSVTEIGRYAFSGCKNLTSINFPKNLKIIKAGLLSRTGISSIEIPSSVTQMESDIFSETLLESLVIPETVTSFVLYDTGCLCDVNNRIGFIVSDCAKLTSVTLPKNLKKKPIPRDLFAGCSNLVEINNIEILDFSESHEYDSTFEGCSKLSLATQKKVRELGYKGKF